MAGAGKRGARERVLEGRHVVALFLLMLLFSGVFFTLGYLMGRGQDDGQVRAAGNARLPASSISGRKTETAPRPSSSPTLSDPAADAASGWDFYDSTRSSAHDNNLQFVPSASSVKAVAPRKVKSSSRNVAPPAGSYTLQVAALRRQADALSLAASLQRKKFPAFVASPHGDKYFRVQVGPYADQKSADAAQKALEGAGFKAIVKH